MPNGVGNSSRVSPGAVTRELRRGHLPLRDRGAHAALALVPAQATESVLVDLVVPRMGLQFPRQMSYESWLRIGGKLSSVANSSAWCLGDWVAYGEVAYDGRYRDAIERTSLDYQTLRNYAWVARRFALSRRRDKLSFGHHAEVAALPEVEQDFWLRKAEEASWSRNQLRREVRASLRERDGSAADQPPPVPPSPAGHGRPAEGHRGQPAAAEDSGRPDGTELVIEITPAQLRVFERAAVEKGLSISSWAAQTLDEAARPRKSDPSRKETP